jgi:hypothetical protein
MVLVFLDNGRDGLRVSQHNNHAKFLISFSEFDTI